MMEQTRNEHRIFMGNRGVGWTRLGRVLGKQSDRLWDPPGLLSTGYGGSFPGDKAAVGVKLRAEVKECVELYLHSPIRLHVVVLS